MPTCSNLLSGTLALLSAQLGKIPGDFKHQFSVRLGTSIVNLAIGDERMIKGSHAPLIVPP